MSWGQEGLAPRFGIGGARGQFPVLGLQEGQRNQLTAL